jgi:hypothetical protein
MLSMSCLLSAADADQNETYTSDAVGANAVNFKRSRHVAHVRAIDAGQRVCQMSDRCICHVHEEQQTLDSASVG